MIMLSPYKAVVKDLTQSCHGSRNGQPRLYQWRCWWDTSC